ncbi:MAG: DUF5687 family protein [Ginsengibacter sp.]
MIKQFLLLEWKSFSRSASFKMNLFLKIFLGIIGVFYLLLILFLGVAAFFALKEKSLEPLSTVNKYLIYWWLADLMIRYFMQKSPVMYVKPFLSMPLRKGKIVHFLLGKSAFSIFNIYAAFFFLPFTLFLLVNGYSIAGALAWHIAIASLVYANNYLNLLIDNLNRLFIVVALVLITFGALQYYEYLDISIYTGPVFQAFYDYPALGFGMISVPVFLYRYSFNYFKKILRIDEAVQPKQIEADTESFAWLEKFGTLGTFLKNDIKLIKRNKRSKSTVLISIFFLFYGLLIFSSKSYEGPTWQLFAGLFVSGGFLFTFGGFVPSWDSAYYPLMMSQSIKYKEYLLSKWWLIVIATTISVLVSAFYLVLGWEVYMAIIVGGIYNIGVNAHLVLLGGAYVKTPIDLTSGKKAFGDKKAFNLKTLLITLPKLLLPLVIFYVFHKYWGIEAGYLSVAILGIVGLALRNKVFSIIEDVYKKEKYATLAAYKEKN